MINVGIAGVGFMGWIHWLAYPAVKDVRVAAVCSRDPKKRAGDWRDIKGNFGPPGEQVDLSGLATFETLDAMLADPGIDLVDLCLPPHLHVDATLRALAAGKHVLVEKPMALTAEDCDRMVAAARDADRQLLVGHVLPFFPEYVEAMRIIREGKHGKVLGGTFKRVISDPTWLRGFFDPAKVGGPLVDLHVHDAHLVRLLFGMPESVTSRGRMRGETVEYCETLFRLPDPSLVVHAASGVINPQGRPFTYGFEIHLEKAAMQFEFAVIEGEGRVVMPLTVYDESGKARTPEIGDGDPVRAFTAELSEAARAVASGNPSPLLSGDLARDAIVLCHRQAESVRTGGPVRV